MSKIYQQVFLPASKGLVTSAPSSLIQDGAFSEVNNVRFDDGYVEKVKAFVEHATIENGSPVLAINLYRINNGHPLNMIHTTHGVYCVRDKDKTFDNLMKSSENYEVSELGYISA